jgi:ribosomal protein S3
MTGFGTIGVKVWINRGEYKTDSHEEKPVSRYQPRSNPLASRRRESLADRAHTPQPAAKPVKNIAK